MTTGDERAHVATRAYEATVDLALVALALVAGRWWTAEPRVALALAAVLLAVIGTRAWVARSQPRGARERGREDVLWLPEAPAPARGSHKQIMATFAEVRAETAAQGRMRLGVPTESAVVGAILDEMEVVATQSDAGGLLEGPTGVGKSLIAARFAEVRKEVGRRTGPFVEVNCATLEGAQGMSKMFGHVAGAYTGATGDRVGLLREAHGGTLLLDEVGDLSMEMQTMLMTVLETKRFSPMGSEAVVEVDVCIVGATCRDLAAMVEEGTFRPDLLARLSTWRWKVPPLTERRQDLDPTIDFELRVAEKALARDVTMLADARRAFVDWGTSDEALWPANFRDVSQAMDRMATLAKDGVITLAGVTNEIKRLTTLWAPAGPKDLLVGLVAPKKLAVLSMLDRGLLAVVVRECRRWATITEAARSLYLPPGSIASPDVSRLRRYLDKFDLTWEDVKRT